MKNQFFCRVIFLLLMFICLSCEDEDQALSRCSRSEDCSANEECINHLCEVRLNDADIISEGGESVQMTADMDVEAGAEQAGEEQAGAEQAGAEQAGAEQAGVEQAGVEQAGTETCQGRGCSCVGSWDCHNDELCLRTTQTCVPIECQRDLECSFDSVCVYGLCLADTAQDQEHDGVPDAVDSCPFDINPDQEDLDRDGLGDTCDDDIDGDGILNENDNCLYTVNPNQSDGNQDGVGDECAADIDGDGVLNIDDICPFVYNPADLSTGRQRDLDGDLIGDHCDPDLDGDTILNEADLCPFLSNPEQGDLDQDGLGDACDMDIDGDSIRNNVDNCPYVSNPEQIDSGRRGIGDACNEDLDQDGHLESLDNCPNIYNPNQDDLDQDGQGDACDDDIDNDGIANQADLCPRDRSSDQSDLDGDGQGDICDLELDGDGISNISDNCPRHANPNQLDSDLDGIGDACDLDRDRDGIGDDLDNCPGVFNGGQSDQDQDGLGDVCDADLDGDGFLNQDDLCPSVNSPIQSDLDLDHIGDPCDPDLDGDGILNEFDNCLRTPNPNQSDEDEDGIGDLCDRDYDRDDVLDEVDNCRFVPNTPQSDLDLDGIGDLCDLDIDGDGVPNELDNCPRNPSLLRLDLDQDGLGDPCDPDMDGDGVPNELDNCLRVINTDQSDSNMNGIGDLCDQDLDQDGVIDGIDNCPNTANPTQLDQDQDGLGNLCDDDPDGDGLSGELDNCPLTPSLITLDSDQDGLGDPCDSDQDEDGIVNLADNCPRVFNPNQSDQDDDGVGDLCDIDSDADGTLDIHDNCPNIYNSTQADFDGDGLGDPCDSDIDGDGYLNADDLCPRLLSLIQEDLDGDGLANPCDPDDDGDLVSDQLDNCALLPNPLQQDQDLNGIGDLCDLDTDQDGIIDGLDNCPNHPNPSQLDLDGDHLGNLCDPDADNDGIEGPQDNCPLTASSNLRDLDGDGLGDICDLDDDGDGINDDLDNCPQIGNPNQIDSDGDGEGDICQIDFDSDGVIDSEDNCPFLSNFEQNDLDSDGVGDLCDHDIDGDGIVNLDDNCPTTFSLSQRDLDSDGIGDLCDSDIDNDYISNEQDNCPLVANNDQYDADSDGRGDACDSDADNDGIPDAIDLCPLTSDPLQQDQDDDQIGDLCDSDLDGDGILNRLDHCPSLASINNLDLDQDGLGDVCDPDIDGDGIINDSDNCPLTANSDQAPSQLNGIGLACSQDQDLDGIDDGNDSCPTSYNPSQVDLDGDGLGDACDPDLDQDGVPNTIDVCPNIYDPSQDDPYLNGTGLACAGATAEQPILVFNQLIGGQLDTSTRPDLRSGNCGGHDAPEVAYRVLLSANERIYVNVEAEHQNIIGIWVNGTEVVCSVDQMIYTADEFQIVDVVIDGRNAGDQGWITVDIERIAIEFSSRSSLATSNGTQSPSDFKAVDLDHDGLDELITLDVTTNNLSYWRKVMDSDASELRLPTELNPQGVEIGQWIGDELDDVMTLNTNSQSVSLFAGHDSSGLSSPVHLDLSSPTVDIHSVDFDQDGTHELVCMHTSGELGLYRVSHEELTLLDTIQTNTVATQVISGDLNGDTWPEIIILDSINSQMVIYWAEGQLEFGNSEVFSIPAMTQRLLVGDLDNDQKDDLVLFSEVMSSAIIWYSASISSSEGQFEDQYQLEFIDGLQTAPTLVDLNLDGLLDVFVIKKDSSYLKPTMYLQDLDRQWRTGIQPNTGPTATPRNLRGELSLAFADLNGDGQRELYFEEAANQLTWVYLLNESPFDQALLGDLTTYQPPDRTWAKGDLNGDGLLDYVMPDNGFVSIVLADPQGLYKAPFQHQTGFDTSWVQIVDLNRDHRNDLLMIANDKLLYSRGNQGDPLTLLDDPIELFELNGYANAFLHDLNQDGFQDLVVNYMDLPFEIYFGAQNDIFQAPLSSNINTHRTHHCFLFDHDNDGEDEIIVANQWNSSMSCEIHSEIDTVGIQCEPGANYHLLPGYKQRVDLDLNGELDLVFNVLGGSDKKVHYNQDPEALDSPLGRTISPQFPIDINGDGVLDLVNFQTKGEHATGNKAFNRFIYQTQPREFTAPLSSLRRTGLSHYPHLVLEDDLNRDGRKDLTIINSASIYWIEAPMENVGSRDNESLGVSSRIHQRSTLPQCPPMSIPGQLMSDRLISFEVNSENCQVSRLSFSVNIEVYKKARWSLQAPNAIHGSSTPITFLFGNQDTPNKTIWTARDLPRLTYFEGSPAQGTWLLQLTHGFCDDGACEYLPELNEIVLNINPEIMDPLSLDTCQDSQSITDDCAWLGNTLDINLDTPGRVIRVALPIGEALSDQNLSISGVSKDEVIAKLFLAGAKIPFKFAYENQSGDLSISWTPNINHSQRALFLEIQPTVDAELPLNITLSR